MRVNPAGQLTNWVDALEGRCYVCGACDVLARDKIGGTNLCKKHWHEYLLGDTDWWELIRLLNGTDR